MNNSYRFWLILVILLISLSGCTKEEEAIEQVDLSDISSEQLIEVDFLKMFDYEVQETFHFSGTGEYYRRDTLERIDDVKNPSNYKLYVFERNIDDMSGGYNGDLTSTFELKVSEDQVSYNYIDGIEQVLLQKPLVIGRTWETLRLDSTYGFIRVLAKLDEVTEDGDLVVSYVSMEDYIEESDFAYSTSMVFSKDNGLIGEYIGDPSMGIQRTLIKTSTSPEPDYISRYVNPSDVMKALYQDDEFGNYVSDGLIKAWVWQESESDSERYETYENYLNGLPENRVRNIARAASTLKSFMAKSDEDFELVESFVTYYETTIGSLDAGFLNIDGIDPLDAIFTFYDYDGESNHMYVIPSSEQSNATNAAVSDLLYGNGINIVILEGYPYIRTDADFLMRTITATSEKIQDYLDYKELQYDIFPLYTEGYLIQSPDAIANALYGFETYAHKYPSDYAFEDASYYSEYFFSVLVLPSMYDVDYKYNASGYLNDSFKAAYETYVTLYQGSKYTSYFEEILNLLETHSGKYSSALNDYLIELGYDADTAFMSEAIEQLSDYNAIQRVDSHELPTRRKVVTVDSMSALIDAIGPNTEIRLEPGLYSIPYVDMDMEYVRIESGIMHIRDVTGLTIVGLGNDPVDMVTESYYEVVILTASSDIYFSNIRMGHTYPYCVGDVLNIQNSDDIYLDKMILFGCGYNGITLSFVDTFHMTNSLISDCQASALNFDHVSDVSIEATKLLRNGQQVIRVYEGEDITFSSVAIRDNTKIMYETGAGDGLLSFEETPSVIFDRVSVKGMTGQTIITGGGQVYDLEGEEIEF